MNNQNTQGKREAARELLQLKGFGAASASDAPRELADFQDGQLRALIELYVEYFSDEQLQVQLDFYRSAMGRSILETESKISAKLESIVPHIAKEAVARNASTDVSQAGKHRKRLSLGDFRPRK